MLFDPNKINDSYDRCIYYKVGNQRTTSKILALEWANGDMNQISFHWNEAESDQINWIVEPTESMESLIDRTVQRIRSQHNKVNLFYSAGYDSQTIYEAFRRNNLKIDRFILWRREWYKGYSDIEFNTALESAKWIKQHVWPGLEIVTVEWRIKDSNAWYRNLREDWIYHVGSMIKFSKHSRELIYTYNDDVQKAVLNHSNTITINGHEKSKLDICDGNWYVTHFDSSFFTEMHDPCLQFFYIPEIYLKQSWMTIRWMESLPNFTVDLLHKIQSHDAGPTIYRDYSLAMGRTMVWHKFNEGGQGKFMWTHPDPRKVPESIEFLKQASVDSPDVVGYYDRGLNYIQQKFGHLIEAHGNLPGIFSKKYFVKKLELSAQNPQI